MKKLTKFIIIISLSLCIFSVFAPVTVSAYFGMYIVNENTGKFHEPDCSYLPYFGNRYYMTYDEIKKHPEFSPCLHCITFFFPSYTPESQNNSSSSSEDKKEADAESNSGKSAYEIITELREAEEREAKENAEQENKDYKSFKEAYNKFTRLLGWLIPVAIIAFGAIFSLIVNSLSHDDTLELIKGIILIVGISLLLLDILAILLGGLAFYIIELFI